jgi:EpsI family protein
MLFTLHTVIVKIWPGKHEAKGLATQKPTFQAVWRQPEERVQPKHERSQNDNFRFVVTALLLLVTALLLQARGRTEILPSREKLASVPTQVGVWRGTDFPLDKQTLEILGNGEFLSRVYQNIDDSVPEVELFIAYFASQRARETPHSPSHCLPGAGWTPSQKKVIQIPRGDGSTFPANRYVVSKAGERLLVIYWFQAHDREVASEYLAKYYLISDAIHMNRSDGALVRLMTPMAHGESADAAQGRLMNVGSQIIPLLNRYIPR